MTDFFSIPEITNKYIFDTYFATSIYGISELTFTNIFMWRKQHKYLFWENDGLLWIKFYDPKIGECIFMPLGVKSERAFLDGFSIIYNYFLNLKENFTFSRVEKEQLGFFSKIKNCKIEVDRVNWDYIYNTDDLLMLRGKKYDSKRNHINKFIKNYQYSAIPINYDNIEQCFKIAENWYLQKSNKGYNECLDEYNAIVELLKHYFLLKCKGILVSVNDKYMAFAIGEMLNSDTVVIHVEKAEYGIDGLYQFINQKFIQMEWSNTKYINREQDLGIIGLRKSKESYQPLKYIEKYNVYINVL